MSIILLLYYDSYYEVTMILQLTITIIKTIKIMIKYMTVITFLDLMIEEKRIFNPKTTIKKMGIIQVITYLP